MIHLFPAHNIKGVIEHGGSTASPQYRQCSRLELSRVDINEALKTALHGELFTHINKNRRPRPGERFQCSTSAQFIDDTPKVLQPHFRIRVSGVRKKQAVLKRVPIRTRLYFHPSLLSGDIRESDVLHRPTAIVLERISERRPESNCEDQPTQGHTRVFLQETMEHIEHRYFHSVLDKISQLFGEDQQPQIERTAPFEGALRRDIRRGDSEHRTDRKRPERETRKDLWNVRHHGSPPPVPNGMGRVRDRIQTSTSTWAQRKRGTPKTIVRESHPRPNFHIGERWGFDRQHLPASRTHKSPRPYFGKQGNIQIANQSNPP